MIYSLKRIIHNLKRHLTVYLLFIVQFAAGTLILCSALNVLFTAKKELKTQQKEMAAEHAIELVAQSYFDPETEWVEQESLKQGMPVSYDTYLKLVEKYKEDFTFQYAVETHYIAGMVHNMEEDSVNPIPEVNVWFVNDEVFEAYFGISMEQNKIYAGENAYKVLCELKQWSNTPEQYQFMYAPDNVIWVENGEYTIAHKDTFELMAMPPSEKTQIEPSIPNLHLYSAPLEDEYYRPDLVDCIFIPMSEFPVYEEFNDALDWNGELKDYRMQSFNTLQKAQYKSQDYKVETISEMLNFLAKESHMKERGAKVEFTLNQKQIEMQEFVEYLSDCLSDYLVMALSVLLVVMLGTTGLFLIFLYRRKKQMAVAIAYGATRGRLFLELFTEIFLITGIGAGLGLSALGLTADFFHSFYAGTTFQISCFVIIFLIAVGTSLFTALFAFAGVGEIAPAKILKEL